MRNPPGIGTSESVGLALVLQSGGQYYSIAEQTSGLTVTTTEQASFSTITVTPADTRVGVTTDYSLQFVSPVSPIPAGATIDLQLPSQLSIPTSLLTTVQCTGVGALAAAPTCTLVNGDTVHIASGFASDTTQTDVSAVISGIKNGAASTASQSFALKFSTSSGGIIASEAAGLTVTFTCDERCASCSSTSAACLSCNTTSSFPNYLSDHSNCYDICPPGFFNTLTSTCGTCLAPCATCITSDTQCLSCQTGTYLFNSTCVASCPDTTYLDGAECQPCSSGCLTCGTSSTQCTSCNPASSIPYLHNQQCISSCPDGYLATGNACSQCQAPCASCAGSLETCTACVSGYLESNTCVDSCSKGFALNEEGTQCLKVEVRRD